MKKLVAIALILFLGICSRTVEKEEVDQVEKQERQWCLWMSELSNKDAEFWYSQTYKKNFYLTPDQCLEYGVIDEII
jgi:ATP-dependent protease ClpP protease subunit